jgi:DHA3 family macrolide efflux protein-like MFS transporter
MLIVSATIGIGLSLVFFGVSSALLIATVFLFATNVIGAVQNSTYRALWQAKVEPDVQGRVFSARMMIVLLGAPLAFVLVGPLMDHLFVPLTQSETIISSLIEQLFGTGVAAPYRAFFSVAGVATVIAAVAGWAYAPLRHLERDIPDFETP